MVEQAPRCCNHDLDAGAQCGSLRCHIHAAEYDGGAQGRMTGIRFHVVRNLIGQLARRCQDQRARRMARRRCAVTCLPQQFLNDRQRKPSSLAGAGLGCAHHIITLQDNRNRLSLNRCRVNIALVGKRTQNFGGKPEVLKTNGWRGVLHGYWLDLGHKR